MTHHLLLLNAYSYAYTFDLLDRRITETITLPDTSEVVLTTGYGTRKDSLRTTFSASINGIDDFLTSYQYDALLRTTRIQQTGQNGGNPVADKRIDFTYTGNDRFATISRYADLGASNLVATSTFVYDDEDRLTSLIHAQGSTTLAFYNWTFDDAGRIIRFDSIDGTSDYTYDEAGQLTAADHDFQDDEDYVYDDNGNRVTANGSSYTTGDQNRLDSDGTYNYEYDAEGNRTKRTEISSGDYTEYQWDVQNRLVSVSNRNSSGVLLAKFEYTYDVFGRRIGKSFDNDGDGSSDRKEWFVYDGTDIILDFVDADGDGETESAQVDRRYVWGPMVDQILAQENVLTGETLWPLTDHQGTVRDLAEYDEQTQITAIDEHFKYNSFGEITSGDPSKIRYTYTAQEYDSETGYYSYDARIYDAPNAVFLSEDPARDDINNLYRYVGNDPLNRTDPTGKYDIETVMRRAESETWFQYEGGSRADAFSALELAATITALRNQLRAIDGERSRSWGEWWAGDFQETFPRYSELSDQATLATPYERAAGSGNGHAASGIRNSWKAAEKRVQERAKINAAISLLSQHFMELGYNEFGFRGISDGPEMKSAGGQGLGGAELAASYLGWNTGGLVPTYPEFTVIEIVEGGVFLKGVAKSAFGYLLKKGVAETVDSGVKIATNRVLHTGARTIEAVATSKQAESIYSWIRGLDSMANVKAVARNTDLPEWYIEKIRQHIFFEKHLLPAIDDPSKLVLRHFDADDQVAMWWKAATTGGIPQEHLGKVHRLFAHEYVEHSLIKVGLPYRIFDESGEAVYNSISAHDLAPLVGDISIESVFDPLYDIWKHWR